MPLTPAKRAALDALHADGRLTGVATAYHKLRDNGVQITKNEIAEYMRNKPSIQTNRLPHSTEGTKNTVTAVIPPPIPLSMVFSDTMFLPASLRSMSTKRVYRGIIVYIDALTKLIHLEPASFRSELAEAERPASETARDGLIRFRDKARQKSGLPNLHIGRVHTDGGSEYSGAFARTITALQAAHPGSYVHTKTSGSRASSNAMAERVIATVRRIIYSHQRSVAREWEENNVPAVQRRYDWLDHLQRFEDTYNDRRHSTIRETPNRAITGVPIGYRRLQQRIIKRALRRYGPGARIPDRFIVGRTSEANRVLQVGDLVRKQQWKPAGPGKAVWNAAKSNKASAGGNYSTELFRVLSTRPAQGLRQTSYRLATLDGREVPGMWIRTQLLSVPESTLDNITDDESDEEKDDDDNNDDAGNDDAGDTYQDARTVDPRPLVPKAHRYRIGDTLFFAKEFFLGDDIVIGGLEKNPRERLGVVTELDRERPDKKKKGYNRGRYLYTIAFENGRVKRTVDRLPLDRDPDVSFVREMPTD